MIILYIKTDHKFGNIMVLKRNKVRACLVKFEQEILLNKLYIQQV